MFNTFLVQPLFNLLLAIYAAIPGQDFGVAIIILTVLVRLLLWPLVSRQFHSQRAIQSLAPEVAKLRAQAKGDKTMESKLLMDLYKDKGINPFSSIGLALIQFPILIALFFVLRDIIKAGEVAKLAYGPLQNLDSIKTIVAGGAINTYMFGVIDLASKNLALAIAAGAAQYFQTKQLTPKGATPTDPTARAMKSMNIVFPGLTVMIGLSLPAALPLYWAVSSGLMIIQQWWLLRADATDLEAQPAAKKPKLKGKSA